MKIKGIMMCVITSLSVIWFSGCVATQSYANPGIQPMEVTILEKGYYWNHKDGPYQLSDAQIEAIFERAPSAVVESGERAELCAGQLACALAASGDQHFALLLSRQPRNIQKSVIDLIQGMWTFHKLHYPLTEKLAIQNGLTD